MEKLVQSGRVRSIGVSNFNSEQMDRILSIATIKPVTNQVECHPNLNQRQLIDFSRERNITITAYSPLGRPHTQSGKKLAISDPKVLKLAQKYGKTPAQIILRYTVCKLLFLLLLLPSNTFINNFVCLICRLEKEEEEEKISVIGKLSKDHVIVTFFTVNFSTKTERPLYPNQPIRSVYKRTSTFLTSN